MGKKLFMLVILATTIILSSTLCFAQDGVDFDTAVQANEIDRQASELANIASNITPDYQKAEEIMTTPMRVTGYIVPTLMIAVLIIMWWYIPFDYLYIIAPFVRKWLYPNYGNADHIAQGHVMNSSVRTQANAGKLDRMLISDACLAAIEEATQNSTTGGIAAQNYGASPMMGYGGMGNPYMMDRYQQQNNQPSLPTGNRKMAVWIYTKKKFFEMCVFTSAGFLVASGLPFKLGILIYKFLSSQASKALTNLF